MSMKLITSLGSVWPKARVQHSFRVSGFCIALLGLCLTSGPDQAVASCLEVQSQWQAPAQVQDQLFESAAFLNDGAVLASTGGSLHRIELGGESELIYSGGRVLLDPAAPLYGFFEGQVMQVFNLNGEPRGVVQADPLGVSLVPGAELVFVPTVDFGHDSVTVRSAAFFKAAGEVAGAVEVSDLFSFQLDKDRFAYATHDTAYVYGLEGDLRFKVEGGFHKFDIAGDHMLAVERGTGRLMVFEGNHLVAEQEMDAAVWNIDLSPSGRFKVATTKNRLYTFDGDQLMADVPLSAAFANSVAISDRGEILVGAQDGEGGMEIQLLDIKGNLLWSGGNGREERGFWPAVSFDADGNRFLVISLDGLMAYHISRSLGSC